MINGKLVVVLIPARGGSKELPGKNLRPLVDRPLIAWSIEQAKACSYYQTGSSFPLMILRLRPLQNIVVRMSPSCC